MGGRKKSEQYLNVKLSVFRIIFIGQVAFIFISLGLTITLYLLYNEYFEGIANRIILGVNSGILGSLGITLIVLIPIAYMASKKMASPLIEMKKVALSMTKGDFTVRANEGYTGEIGELATSLNQLSKELATTIGSLTVEKNLLKQLLDSMGDGVVGLGQNQEVLYLNNAFCKLFQIEGKMEELTDNFSSRILNMSRSSFQERKTIVDTISYQDKNILMSCYPIQNEIDEVVGVVSIFNDVTEALRLEQTRRDYVANVSHELRSPLTAIKGLIIPLKEGMVKDEAKRAHFYDIIYNEIERLNRLVNDLFELSRLQSSSKAFEMHKVNISNMLLDEQDKYALLAKEKNINIEVQKDNDYIPVEGNIDRINQVLTILVDNALKFAEEGSTIKLIAREENTHVIISVENNGYLKQEEATHIFDRFYKVDKAHTSEGAGLGLSIAMEVITRMNGSISVRTNEENFVAFEIKLAKIK